MRNTPHNRIAVSRPTTAPTPKWFHSDLNIWFILYVDCSNIVQSIRELRVRRYALFVAAFPFGAERIQSQSHYQPALSSFLFFSSLSTSRRWNVCVPFAQPFEMQISRHHHLICIGRPYGLAGGSSSAALGAQWISARFPSVDIHIIEPCT